MCVCKDEAIYMYSYIGVSSTMLIHVYIYMSNYPLPGLLYDTVGEWMRRVLSGRDRNEEEENQPLLSSSLDHTSRKSEVHTCIYS